MKTMSLCNLIFILTTLALSACSPLQTAINPYEEDFKCRAKNNEGECVDTPTAYRNARYAEAKLNILPSETNVSREVEEHRYKILAELLQEPEKPLLQPPKILRVLLLPYTGENDELFMSRYVYVKIENSKWILTDLSEK